MSVGVREAFPEEQSGGPLAGLRVVEFASIGPAPFAVMLLADLGAEVVRIQRADADWPDLPVVTRGRASLTLDLKSESGRRAAAAISKQSDILVEGSRPGVMERLGLGPDALLKLNERLIYGRMTGWGQDGPLSASAGHDINFIGLTGMLGMLAVDENPPRPPQNLLGDYAGGGLYLALGILAAVHERQRSGLGQIVDAAIIDGSASLLAPIFGMVAAGLLPANPSQGMLAGAEPYYRTYRCADGRFLAVGALERRFRLALTERLGLEPDALDRSESTKALEELFVTRARDEWIALLAGCDCCVSPVLDLEEASAHPQLSTRGCFLEQEGQMQPAPAPRFSRTPARLPGKADATRRLSEWDVELSETAR